MEEELSLGGFQCFIWDQSDFYCPGRNCSWLLHIGNLMSWLWKYQTLTICWAVTDCTHLWNDAVILELLLQQSVFLLQCLNLVKSILTNIGIVVNFLEFTWLERRSFSAEMPWWTERIIILETTLSNTSFSSITWICSATIIIHLILFETVNQSLICISSLTQILTRLQKSINLTIHINLSWGPSTIIFMIDSSNLGENSSFTLCVFSPWVRLRGAFHGGDQLAKLEEVVMMKMTILITKSI